MFLKNLKRIFPLSARLSKESLTASCDSWYFGNGFVLPFTHRSGKPEIKIKGPRLVESLEISNPNSKMNTSYLNTAKSAIFFEVWTILQTNKTDIFRLLSLRVNNACKRLRIRIP